MAGPVGNPPEWGQGLLPAGLGTAPIPQDMQRSGGAAGFALLTLVRSLLPASASSLSISPVQGISCCPVSVALMPSRRHWGLGAGVPEEHHHEPEVWVGGLSRPPGFMHLCLPWGCASFHETVQLHQANPTV